MTAKFDNILDLESALRVSKALGGMIVGDPKAIIARDQRRLYDAIGSLSAAEMVAFGEYRKDVG